jgi:regulation of enolase protein 1 (concanavalin A-like superfamily)
MKRSLRILFALLWLQTACEKNTHNMESCNLTINDITFSHSLNGACESLNVDQVGKIVFKSGPKTDFFNAADGKTRYANAPILCREIDNTKAFSFSAKVSPAFGQTYDAGAFYLYEDDMHWQKFAFEMDERGATRMVTVRTVDTSDDANHEIIPQSSVYMKIASNVESIGYYYSLDAATWQLLRIYKNDFPAKVHLGISSQSPMGEGIEVIFEDIRFEEKSPADMRKGI